MSEKSLFNLVNEAMGNNENNKVLVGYTVSSYVGVLSALKTAQQKISEAKGQTTTGDVGRTITTTRYSILSQMGLDGVDDGTGFIEGQYQGLCIFKDFMSFIVDANQGDGKKNTMYVPVNKNYNSVHVNNGVGCISGNPIFPASIKKESNYYVGLEDENDTFKIGVGLDISNFGLKFFKRFFPQIEWSEQKLKSIAGKSGLFAEVVLPFGKGSNNAKVLHAMVISDIPDSSGAPFQVHIPNPLLILNEYSSIGSVRVKFNSKSQAVGTNDIVNPLASKRYYHKDAKIDGFTPKYVADYTKGSEQGGIVTYEGTSLCSGNLEVKGRVRLFFDSDKKDMVSKIIGNIPAEYENELFKGSVSDDQIIKTETVISGSDVASFSSMPSSSKEVLEQFNQKLTTKIPTDGLYKALLVVANFESGGNWTLWKNIGDNQGVSAGALQCTEKSGGIAHVIETFISIKKADGGDCTEEEKLLQRAKAHQLTDLDAALWKQMYNENPMRMQVAQIKAWAEGYHGKAAIAACNAFQPTSPLAFAAIAGSVNHWPGIMLRHFKADGMSSSMDEKDKAIMAEAIHLKVSIRRQTGKVVSAKDIAANPLNFKSPEYVGKWSGWCNRCKSVIDGANRGDLQIANVNAYKN